MIHWLFDGKIEGLITKVALSKREKNFCREESGSRNRNFKEIFFQRSNDDD